jgi:aryl-alcohol dehydrogenase-like predicted oxidoreductase
MRTRSLGAGGPDVSVVGLGCNNFGSRVDERGTRAVVDAALDAGVTLFDTADVYGNRGGSEELLAKALEGRRDRVVLATKFGHEMSADAPRNRGSREYIRSAIEASLGRLRTDVVDVYQYHRPDGVTPIEETLGAMSELVDEGKVRYIGSSNFDAAQVMKADDVAKERSLHRYVSAQNEFSLLKRPEEELLEVCHAEGIGMLPYFPLASGLLTGKYRRGEPAPAGSRLATRPERLTAEVFDELEALEAFAKERGHTLLELAFAGLLVQHAVSSVIAGATKPEQVRANAAAGNWELDKQELQALLAL